MSSAEYGLVSEDNADFRQVSAALSLAALAPATRAGMRERSGLRQQQGIGCV